MTLQDAYVRASIAVSDIAEARRFYEGVLGLTPQSGGPDGVRTYPCGGGSVLQVHLSEHAGSARGTVASWTVPDVDALVGELAAKGVTFERYDGLDADDNGVHAFGEHRVAWCSDPDGNVLAFDNGGMP